VERLPGRPRRREAEARCPAALTIRRLRHLGTLAFVAFVTHRVYSSSLGDVEERNGAMTSIFTGFTGTRPAGPADVAGA
jgi:Ni,Fe-hydrogenase I cytochrome b subunit